MGHSPLVGVEFNTHAGYEAGSHPRLVGDNLLRSVGQLVTGCVRIGSY